MTKKLMPLTVIVVLAGCISVHPRIELPRRGSPPPTPAPAPAALPEPAEDARLNAVLWMQTAAEYEANALQAFQLAQRMLDRAIASPTWTAAQEQTGEFASLPPAVIVDIDETVLDNSPFEARQIRSGQAFSEELWQQWVLEANAEPIPGALAFTKDAAARGVVVFYVSNRVAAQEEPTRANLARWGFPLDPNIDTVLGRNEQPEWTSDKAVRRRDIAARYRILLLVGDDLGDFTSSRGSLEQRLDAVSKAKTWWGMRWIMIPNPMYGSWERIIVGSEPNLSETEKLRRKVNALRE